MKKSSAYKSKIAMLALSVLFILMTLMGLTLSKPNAAYANPDHALRFKQVALGGDFAIAVNYRGELYGWSLTKAADNKTFGNGDNDATILGDYYPGIPTNLMADLPAGTTVKMVAATRYNAALVTVDGKVYTWGSVQTKNISNQSEGKGSRAIMHLRSKDATPYSKPGLVEKNFDLFNTDTSIATPGLGLMFDAPVDEIYGAEENFIIKAAGKMGAWGSNLFGQLGTNPEEHLYGVSDVANMLRDFKVKWTASGFEAPTDYSNIDAFAGKDYILVRNGNNLYLTGKNFYLNSNTENRSDLSDFNSFAVVTEPGVHANAKSDVGLKFDTTVDGSTFGTVTDGAVGVFGKLDQVNSIAVPANISLKNADGTAVQALPRSQTVAAGAGFLYYIENGNLKMLGNGYANQAGNGANQHYDVSETVLSTGTVTQVVAGRNVFDAGHLTDDNKKLFSLKTKSVSEAQQIGIGVTNTLTSVNPIYADFSQDTSYISAALTLDGTVYAWNADEDVTPVTALDGLLTGSERIVSIVGGYGNHLYALTNTGKLLQVQYDGFNFTAKVHNQFATTDINHVVTSVTNWTTEAEYIKDVFNVAPEQLADTTKKLSERRTAYFNKADASSYAKIGLNDVQVSDQTKVQVGRIPYGGSSYTHDPVKSFVGQNNTADPIRILLDASRDSDYFVSSPAAGAYTVPADSVFAGSQVTGTPVWGGSDASIKFYYNYDGARQEIDRYVVAQYFDLKIEIAQAGATPNGASDIRFKIVPKMATKSGAVTMEFAIARYDDAREYASVTPTIYEWKKVAFDIVIGYSGGEYNKFSTNADAGKIPLLDVNGTLNKEYSIATMDVSTGFRALGAELSDLTNQSFSGGDFVDGVHNSLIAGGGNKDPGFPSSTYAAELSYYDEDSSQYYNDHYRYFSSSVDGSLMFLDEVRIYASKGILNNYASQTNYMRATRKQVTAEVSIAALLGIDPASWAAQAAVTGSDANKIKSYLDNAMFDNKYGFYAVAVEPSTLSPIRPSEGETLVSGITLTSTGVLKLTYQVLTFRALTTATDSAEYNEQMEINKPILNRNNAQTLLNYEVRIRECRIANGKVQSIIAANTWLEDEYVTLHTHASLKLLDSKIMSPVSGLPGQNYTRYNGGTMSGRWDITIGEKSTYSVNLVDLMQMDSLNTLGYDFKFAYRNTTPNDSGNYEGFTKSFNQGSIDPAKTFLTESKMSFFFLEETELSFTVNIVKTTRTGEPFQYNVGGMFENAEQITLEFFIRARLTTEFGPKSGAPKTISFSDSHEISVSDFVTEENIAPEFIQFSKIDIPKLSGTNESIVEVAIDSASNNRKAVITAVGNGVTYLHYTIKLLNKHEVSGIVQLEVMHVSEYRTEANPLSITERDQVQISDLSTFLRGENVHLGLTSLAVDREKGTSGITIQHKAATDTEWSDITLAEAPYIQSVSIEANDGKNLENGAHLSIILKSVQQGANIGVSRILVHFSSTRAGDVVKLSAAIVVTPAHTELMVSGGADNLKTSLVINVRYQEGYASNLSGTLQAYEMPTYGTDSENKKVMTVPIAYFFSKELTGKSLGDEGARNYMDYAITQATISDKRIESKDMLKYLTCDPSNSGEELLIRPLYPTAELAANYPGTPDGVQVTLSFISTKNQAERDSFDVSFYISVSQIKMTLELNEWGIVFLIAGAIVLAFLFIIFIIRLIVYLKRRAEQKRIIKKNQMLIRMRDKMHHSSGTPNRSQAVKAKMKINDPKYAKMFDEMRREKEAETGITLDNSAVAQKAENTSKTMDRVRASKKSKKKSKKSIDDLKAELEAKRSALAKMQVSGEAHSGPDDGEISMDPAIIESAPVFGGYNAELSREDVEDQIKAKLEEGGFVEFEPMGNDEDML